MNDEPLAFFITFTVYGTFLQGDSRWWRSREDGSRPPQPKLEHWHRDRLIHDVILLDAEQCEILQKEIERFCGYRDWKLWNANPRTNHVHVVVTASGYAGSKVRDQIKANCTRVLREHSQVFVDRPIWSVGGDWKCVNTLEDLEQIIRYVDEAQGRKGREQTPKSTSHISRWALAPVSD